MPSIDGEKRISVKRLASINVIVNFMGEWVIIPLYAELIEVGIEMILDASKPFLLIPYC